MKHPVTVPSDTSLIEEINGKVEDIFRTVIEYIQKEDGVDLEHLYIDGSKFEASANKYTWVWKKSTEKFKYRLFEKITQLLNQINGDLAYTGLKVETNTEYTPQCLEMILSRYAFMCRIDEESFVHSRGHRKTQEQHYYEKLKEYVKKIRICGPDCNSYSKTDHDATFMRMKKDYIRNNQLLPAYNIQIGVADEYIAVVDVMQYRSDMDCFVPMMEKFKNLYGFYPVADAGYGLFNNYIYCQEHGIENT